MIKTMDGRREGEKRYKIAVAVAKAVADQGVAGLQSHKGQDCRAAKAARNDGPC